MRLEIYWQVSKLNRCRKMLRIINWFIKVAKFYSSRKRLEENNFDSELISVFDCLKQRQITFSKFAFNVRFNDSFGA